MENKKVQKKTNNKKISSSTVALRISAIILFMVMFITFLYTLYSSVIASNLAFGDYRFYIMEAENQANVASKGDLVIAKRLKLGEVQVGDKIVYGDGKFYYCDDVEEIKKKNTVVKMITAEVDGIRYRFSEEEISGKIVKNVKIIGNMIKFLKSPIGIVVFLSIVITIIILLLIILKIWIIF